MSTAELISLERDDDGIAVLAMKDEQRRNALGAEFVEQLTDKLHELSADRAAKVAVICGLDEQFCAGGDKQMLLDLASGKVTATDIMLSRAMIEVPIPTIAAMAGHAVGGGLALGLCCDVVLMGRESSYGCSFMNMGFTPGMGTTKLLQLAMGEYIAAEMMFGGQFFRGAHFESRSLVNYVLPRDKVVPKAMKIAARFAEKPRPSLELLKRNLSLGKRHLFEQARTDESFMHEISFSFDETKALIEAHYHKADDED
ncbi:MAG: enoyl-CoA hydratase/isomerase family protein [Deltaproteobacteria bacterium]|nr:enoyl-CoA hydratase/isomerase family protein [Deltaproteobacteria bacterium]